jgi:hypothetical protein
MEAGGTFSIYIRDFPVSAPRHSTRVGSSNERSTIFDHNVPLTAQARDERHLVPLDLQRGRGAAAVENGFAVQGIPVGYVTQLAAVAYAQQIVCFEKLDLERTMISVGSRSRHFEGPAAHGTYQQCGIGSPNVLEITVRGLGCRINDARQKKRENNHNNYKAARLQHFDIHLVIPWVERSMRKSGDEEAALVLRERPAA